MGDAIEPGRRQTTAVGRRVGNLPWFGVAVAAILAVALALRLGFVADTPTYRPVVDAHSYDDIGWMLARGEGYAPIRRRLPDGRSIKEFHVYRPPAYPAFLAGLYTLTDSTRPHGGPHRWTVARVAQALLGVLSVALIGILALQVFGRRVALVALAVAAAYVPLIVVGGAMVSEALFVPLMLAATVCAVAGRRSSHRWRWGLAAGALTGLTALTRENGLLLLVPVVIALWGARPWRSRRAWAAPALALVATVAVIAPWTVRNALVFHTFIPISTSTGNTLAGTYNDKARNDPVAPGAWKVPERAAPYRAYLRRMRRADVPEHVVNRRLTGRVLDYVAAHPLYVPEVGFYNTVRLLDLGGRPRSRFTAQMIGIGRSYADAAVLCFWVVGALALLGVLTRYARRSPLWLWAFPLVLFLSEVFVSTETPRFRAPLDPFVILLAALALTTAGERIGAWRTRPRRRAPTRAAAGAAPPPRLAA